MSFVLPPSINLIEYSGRPWSDIKFTEKDGGTSPKNSSSSPKEYTATRLLPRTDRPLFGQFPKLDAKVLIDCDKCGKVLLRSAFNAHCSTPEHRSMQPIVPPPVASAVPMKAAARNRKTSIKPAAVAGVSGMVLMATPPPPPTLVAASPLSSSNGRSSKHKKSAKSSKRSRKEEKPELEAPAKVGKLDADHLIAAPSIPPSHAFDLAVDVKEEVGEEEEEEHIATSVTVVCSRPAPAFIEATTSATTPNHVISISKHDAELPPVVSIKEEASPAAVVTVTSENHEEQARMRSPSPVDHMPMSPVAVVNIVPVQNFQYLQHYLHLPTQPIVVTIPCTSPSTHMYSYPKPLTVTTRALRRLGNTYLLQNQRMEHQRTEIQAILRSRQQVNHLPT